MTPRSAEARAATRAVAGLLAGGVLTAGALATPRTHAHHASRPRHALAAARPAANAVYVSSWARAVDARGNVAGELRTATGAATPAVWRPALSIPGQAGASCPYEVQALPVPDDANEGTARGLEASDVVVGETWRHGSATDSTGALRAPLPRAARWSDGRLVPLADLAAAVWSTAAGVNARGQIAGTYVDARGSRAGFLITPGRPFDQIAGVARGSPVGARARDGVDVRAVNDSGVVVGTLGHGLDPDDDGLGRRVVAWRAGRLRTLLQVPSAHVVVEGINERGDVWGAVVYHVDDETRPQARRAKPFLLLGDGRGNPRPSPAATSEEPDQRAVPYAYVGVNANGVRLGLTRHGTAPQSGTAYVVDARGTRVLPVPPGFRRVEPAGLNDVGLIAGTAVGANASRAAVWDAPGRIRLLPLAPGVCDVRADSGAAVPRAAPAR